MPDVSPEVAASVGSTHLLSGGSDVLEGPGGLVLDVPRTRRRAASVATTVAVLMLACVPLFYQLGRWPLTEPDEGRNATVAREMLADGHWSVPHFNGLPFLDKPPLLFWTTAAAFRTLGVTEFSARLPAALSGLALVLLTFVMTRVLLDTRRGLVAAVVVATSPLILIFSRIAIFDMPFTALVTLALGCLLQSRLGARPGVWLPLAALAMGLATLTKGPVGVAVPLLGWFAARGALPSENEKRGWGRLLAAIAVFVGVVTPWLVRTMAYEPEFLRYAVIDETWLRFTLPERFHRAGPVYYPMLVAVLGCGLWSAILVGGSPVLWRRARASAPEATAIRFATRVAMAILIFFTLSASKRPGYVLPALVPIGMLVAVVVTTAPRRLAGMVRIAGVASVLLALFLGALVIRAPDQPLAWMPLGEGSPAGMAPALQMAALFLAAWGLLAVFVVSARRPIAAVVLTAALFPGLYGVLLSPLDAYADGRSTRVLAQHVRPGTEVIAFRTFPTSLPFYLGRSVPLVSESGRELTSNYVLSRHERFMNTEHLMTPKTFWTYLANAPQAYVVTPTTWTALLKRKSPRELAHVFTDGRNVLFATKE